jgi:integration host factor subunit beta
MTRSELIARIAEQFPQLQLKDAESAVKVIIDAMSASLSKGERVEIRGFGSFGLNYKPPRNGRNPKSGVSVKVPAKYVPHFKAGKELRERVDMIEYRIDGFHVVDTSTPPKRIPIREILDSECSEFNRSKLTNQQRWEIITELGLDPLTATLAALFRTSHSEHNASTVAKRTYSLLSKSVAA